MKKNSTARQSSKQSKECAKTCRGSMTIGMDLGDKTSRYCAIDQEGKMLFERSVPTTTKGMTQVFGALARCRIALEVGTHSPWVSRMLSGLGHEVIVANARQVKLISMSSRKDDRLDAQHTGTPGASGPAVAAADPAPQRASPNSLAADPSASARRKRGAVW